MDVIAYKKTKESLIKNYKTAFWIGILPLTIPIILLFQSPRERSEYLAPLAKKTPGWTLSLLGLALIPPAMALIPLTVFAALTYSIGNTIWGIFALIKANNTATRHLENDMPLLNEAFSNQKADLDDNFMTELTSDNQLNNGNNANQNQQNIDQFTAKNQSTRMTQTRQLSPQKFGIFPHEETAKEIEERHKYHENRGCFNLGRH